MQRSQAPAWQSQSQALEKVALELQQAQQHLFRQQVSSITADVAGLRREVDQLRSSQEGARAGMTSMVDSRCKEIHQRLGDLADTTSRHGKTHEITKIQLDQLRSIFGSLGHSSGAFGELRDNLDGIASHRAALDAKHASLDENIGNLADKLVYIAERHQQHAEVLEAHQVAHGQLAEELQKHGASMRDHAHQLAGVHAKTTQVMDRLSEQQASSEADRAAIQELKQAHKHVASDGVALHQRCLSVEQHLKHIDGVVGASTSEQARRLQVASNSVQEIHDHVRYEAQRHHSHCNALEDRINAIESTVGGSVGAADLHAAHRKILDVDGQLRMEQTARANDYSNMDSRLRHMEMLLNEGAEKNHRQIQEVMASHAQLRDICGSFEDRKFASDAHQASLGERLQGIEKLMGNAFTEHGKEVQLAKRQVQALQARLDEEKSTRSLSRGGTKERIASLEACLGKPGTKRLKELDQIPEDSRLHMEQTRVPSRLVGHDAGPAESPSWDSDYFRHVSSLIIKDDAADSPGFSGLGRSSPHKPRLISRVTSLPSLTPGSPLA